jgi:hypothetical protein
MTMCLRMRTINCVFDCCVAIVSDLSYIDLGKAKVAQPNALHHELKNVGSVQLVKIKIGEVFNGKRSTKFQGKTGYHLFR